MWKQFILLCGFLTLMVGMANAESLKGKIGVGLNLPGIQVQYGVHEDIVAEAKIQFGTENTLVGGRGYYFFQAILDEMNLKPFAGIEVGVPISPHLTGGYVLGGLAGLGLFATEHIGISADVGLYHVDLVSKIGAQSDLGAIFNLAITYYF